MNKTFYAGKLINNNTDVHSAIFAEQAIVIFLHHRFRHDPFAMMSDGTGSIDRLVHNQLQIK
ncbi:hypothetical protein AL524_06450 [Citrobacter amalonaticus]|nr:hypothetical protein AL524_06450 [Citrobacter amalonaticus]